MRASVALLALSFAIPLSLPARAATGVPCSFYGIDPGAPFDGQEVVLDAAYADRLATARAGAVRVEFVLDADGTWSAADLAAYDDVIDAIRGAGLVPLGLLSYRSLPAGQDAWNDDLDGDGYNAYVDAFAELSTALFSHFAGRVDRWEIWSQPNCFTNPGYAADPQRAGCTYVLPRVFARMLTEVYSRSVDLFQAGKMSLVTGGLLATEDSAPSSGADYLAELYAQPAWTQLQGSAGRRYPWAYLGYQLFIDQRFETAGVNLGGYLDSVRQLAAQHSDNSRFYVTGFGWTTALVGEETQAANLTTATSYLAARDDVAAAYWYGYSDDVVEGYEYGLVTDTGAPKAALFAMRSAAGGCDSDAAPGTGGTGGGDTPTGVTPPGPFGGGGKTAPYDAEGRASSCTVVAAPVPARPAGAEGWLALLASAALLRRSKRAETDRRAA
jgi:hypothetical protein